MRRGRGLSPQGFHEGVVPGLVVATVLSLEFRLQVKLLRTSSGRKEANMRMGIRGLFRHYLAFQFGLAGGAATVLAALAG